MSAVQSLQHAAGYPPGWLVSQLPVGMRDDDLLVRLTTIFERVGATLRAGADSVEHVADTTVTSPRMLTYLGNWLGYDLLDDNLPIERQRDIIAALGEALPLRGTAPGLQRMLEAVTGAEVRIDEPGCVLDDEAPMPEPGGVAVTVASSGHLRPHELEAWVRDEVPAHLPVTITIDPELGGEAR